MKRPETQRLIDHLGEALGMGYWYLDLATNEMYWANQTYLVHGVSPEEYTPDINTAITLYHPDDRDEIQRRVAFVLENKTPFTGLSRIITPAGEVRWIKATIDCQVDEDGNPTALFGTGQDVSKVLEIEHRYEMALSIANIGLWNWDLEKNTLHGNQRSHAIGEGKESVQGDIIYTYESFLSRIHESDRELVIAALEKVLSQNDYVQNSEFRFQAQTGTYRWVKIISKVVEWFVDNSPRRITGLLIDIHESKIAQQKMKQAYEEAAHANRARGEFLANMSHEVRTPMNGILGLTDLLLSTNLDNEQKEHAELIKRSGESLLHILNDILDFSKIESGNVEISPLVFPIDEFLYDIERLYFSDESKQHVFTLDLAPNLPRHLYGDPFRLKQILGNLLSNAIKFTPAQGSIYLSVQLKEQTGQQLTLAFSVRDTGIGIPKEKQQFIFDAFRQADASITREYGGTGLGLAISAKLVEQMGGQISLESAPGKGATFSFTVNLEVGQEAKKRPKTPSYSSTRTLSILVVEDNFVNQRLIDKILQNESHQVTLAKNGQVAIDIFRNNPFDIVLMDIQMPIMGGVEAMRTIRELPGGSLTPIVALTAHALTGDRDRYMALGFDGYLSKPIDKTLLFNELLKHTADSELNLKPSIPKSG